MLLGQPCLPARSSSTPDQSGLEENELNSPTKRGHMPPADLLQPAEDADIVAPQARSDNLFDKQSEASPAIGTQMFVDKTVVVQVAEVDVVGPCDGLAGEASETGTRKQPLLSMKPMLQSSRLLMRRWMNLEDLRWELINRQTT